MPHITELIASAHIDDLRREAEQEALARLARSTRPPRDGFLTRLARMVQRLDAPAGLPGHAMDHQPRAARPTGTPRPPRAAAARTLD